MHNIGVMLVKAILVGSFSTVASMYELMLTFATVISENNELSAAIDGIAESVYTLIAVFMLFRITVSMIEYLVDPDKISDKSAGAGKLITRVIVSLLLLISFNDFIMDKVYDLQNALLESNFVNNLFVGTDGETSDGTDGKTFARGIAASLSSNPEAVNNSDFLETPDGNTWLANQVEEEVIVLDLFMCVIVGLVLAILFAILCIEVLIRQFKLAILQVLAPIAFISYINPNDKVLSTWFQKFVSCFLDLFLKIMGIQMALFFIGIFKNALNNSDISPLALVLLYIAAFLFAKTVPNFICDILGIKDMGGTFKDSMGALKGAALTGAGAVAGAGAGLITGMGKGMSFSTITGGLIGGALRGAQGGMKGNVLKGASEQAKRNNAAKQSNINGGNWWQRRLASVGLDSATLADNNKISPLENEKKRYDEMSGYQKGAEEIAEGSNYMKDLRASNEAARTNGGYVMSSDELEKERDKWASVQASTKRSLDANDGRYLVSDGHTAINGMVYAKDEILKQDGQGYVSTGYTYEGGKAAGIAGFIEQAESTRSGSKFFRDDPSFATPISSYDDMKSAAKESKTRSSQITNEEVGIKHTDSYIAGDASRNKGNK